MQSVLLIDEILRLIFRFCLEHDNKSLACCARTCKAWKEPALDLLWCRLPSPKPLLLLLHSTTNGASVDHVNLCDLLTFNLYARRIKHLNNRHESRISTDLTSMSSIPACNLTLLNLITANISIPRYGISSLPFILSPNLIELDVDLGFKARAPDIDEILCSYLKTVVLSCHGMNHVSLRGLASKGLDDAIRSMQLIPSLSLRLGRSLLSTTLETILTFSNLQKLELHAGHIEVSDLGQVTPNSGRTYLASLKKLRIRAKSCLIEYVLAMIQPNVLCHLHIELDDPSPSDSNWTTIFDHIDSKATTTLLHLALEHHFEIPALNVSPSPDAPFTSHPLTSLSHMSFETLQLLNNLKLLRHFSCDMTLPAVISDEDVAKLVTWWPDLEHLELGSAPYVDQITEASLALIAAKCPKLRRLILPLTIKNLPPSPIVQNPILNQLRYLAIAHLDVFDPLKLAERLTALFPVLQELDGPCDDSQPWIATRRALAQIRPPTHPRNFTLHT